VVTAGRHYGLYRVSVDDDDDDTNLKPTYARLLEPRRSKLELLKFAFTTEQSVLVYLQPFWRNS